MIPVLVALLTIAVGLSLLRFVIGPDFANRMVAVDVLTTVLVGVLVLLALEFEVRIYLDVALALSAVSFIGSIVVGRFIER